MSKPTTPMTLTLSSGYLEPAHHVAIEVMRRLIVAACSFGTVREMRSGFLVDQSAGLWNLHEPPSWEDVTPPRPDDIIEYQGTRYLVWYVATLTDIRNCIDWPAHAVESAVASGLALDHPIVMLGLEGKDEPDRWCPLGRWPDVLAGRTPKEKS